MSIKTYRQTWRPAQTKRGNIRRTVSTQKSELKTEGAGTLPPEAAWGPHELLGSGNVKWEVCFCHLALGEITVGYEIIKTLKKKQTKSINTNLNENKHFNSTLFFSN